MEEVYNQQPSGFVDPSCPTHVCRVLKLLYGLNRPLVPGFDALPLLLVLLVFLSLNPTPLSSLYIVALMWLTNCCLASA
jgi:hypothetical protein